MADSAWFEYDKELYFERYEIVRDRIASMPEEITAESEYGEYFAWASAFLNDVAELFEKQDMAGRSLEECIADQDKMFNHIKKKNYETSFANPAYAVSKYGMEVGQMLTFLTSELDSAVASAYDKQVFGITLMFELFVQVYTCFTENDIKGAKDAIFWHFHDYGEILAELNMKERYLPVENLTRDIIMNADLTDLRYLYRYGMPIGDNEIKIAEFLNSMPEERVQAMADTYTEGYRMGFVAAGKDISKMETVQIHAPVGFERMVRLAIANFEKMGLQSTMSREITSSFSNKGGVKQRIYSTSLNPQYDFDHRKDRAYFFNKSFVNRSLEVMEMLLEDHKEVVGKHSGPAVIEVFGETPFLPESKEEAIKLDDKQQELVVQMMSAMGQLINKYEKGEETSFTIIAYPIPEIGEQFNEIFDATVTVNTLDYVKYQTMQQKLIDVLDQADHVHIQGGNGNMTDLDVSIYSLEDPSTQCAFENCVADVNIPVGEVFTSPVLKGTTGLLHVSEVYLNGLKFVDLKVWFKDGFIEDYSCANFDEEEKNRSYIKDNLLFNHPTIPMGEFAIGTNTTAYKMGIEYGIQDRLPILIAEKTGPHFAVGDTCFSFEEDAKTFNPDGKQMMAKDNEHTLIRNEDPSKAYFNCHTDITIPYNELEAITVFKKDGTTEDIIRDGLFKVPGTEELNEPLLALMAEK